MHNVLITGANGFIGRALCDQLSTDNKAVRVDITGPQMGRLILPGNKLTRPPRVAKHCRQVAGRPDG